MRLSGGRALAVLLGRAPIEETMAAALDRAAADVAERVRAGLDGAPGDAHDVPWLRTGSLRDSIGSESAGLRASVGSNDPAAVAQELGTRTVPARPFLAPVAASMGQAVAESVARRVALVLAGGRLDDIEIIR